MTMTLYHCSGARSVRSLWTMLEMGLEHELVTLQFPPRVHHKEFKDLNPLGTVPLLVDWNAELTESSAICHYLAEKYGPSDLAVRPEEPDYAAYLNWLFRSDATLTFPQTIYFRYTQLEPEERRVPQAAEDYRVWFLARWRCVDLPCRMAANTCARAVSPMRISSSPGPCFSPSACVWMKPPPQRCKNGTTT